MHKKIIISVIFLLSALIATGYSFIIGAYSKEIATLEPEQGAIKIKPKDPGGMVIPHSDSLVYEKIKKGAIRQRKVNLQPDPEFPINMNRIPETKSKFVDSIEDILANIEYYEAQLLDDDLDKENEEHILPNNLLVRIDEQETEADKSLFVSGTRLQIIRALESRYKRLDTNILSENQDGYKIQLSSAYSLSDAKKQWLIIKRKHDKIIKNANLITKKVEGKNERIFFLVMAGTYSSLNHAKLVCRKLAARKQNCIITK